MSFIDTDNFIIHILLKVNSVNRKINLTDGGDNLIIDPGLIQCLSEHSLLLPILPDNVINKTKTDQHLEILFIDAHSGDLCLKIFMACTIRKTLETKGNLVTRLQFSHQSLSIQPFLQLPGFFLHHKLTTIALYNLFIRKCHIFFRCRHLQNICLRINLENLKIILFQICKKNGYVILAKNLQKSLFPLKCVNTGLQCILLLIQQIRLMAAVISTA